MRKTKLAPAFGLALIAGTTGCSDVVEGPVTAGRQELNNGAIVSNTSAAQGPSVSVGTVVNGVHCSGALLDIGRADHLSNAVITAAHCIDGYSAAQLRVYIGNPNSASQFTASQTARATKAAPHDRWVHLGLGAQACTWWKNPDLGVIFLDRVLGTGTTPDYSMVSSNIADTVNVSSACNAPPDRRNGVKNTALLPNIYKNPLGDEGTILMGVSASNQYVIPGDCGSGIYDQSGVGSLVAIVNDFATCQNLVPGLPHPSGGTVIGPYSDWVKRILKSNPLVYPKRRTIFSWNWDGDSQPDDIWLEEDGGALALHIESSALGGELTPIPVTIPGIPTSIESLALGNFDGNGIQMAMVGDRSLQGASLITGVAPVAISSAPATQYQSAFAAPVDSDGYDDLLALTDNGDLHLYWGSPAGLVYENAARVVRVNLDGDGLPDPIALFGNTIYYANALGPHAPLLPNNLVNGTQLVGGNFRGPGTQDVALVGAGDGGSALLIVCSPNAQGSLICSPALDASFMSGSRRPASLVVGDYNNDGFDDLQVAYEGTEPRRVFWGSASGLTSSVWGQQHSFPTTSDTDHKFVQVQGTNELTYFRPGAYYWYVQTGLPTAGKDAFAIEIFDGGYSSWDSHTGNAEGCFKVIPDPNADASTSTTLPAFPPADYFQLRTDGWSTLASGKLSDYQTVACSTAAGKCTFRIEARSGSCVSSAPANSGGNAFKLRVTGLEPVRVLRDGYVFVNRGDPSWSINIHVDSGSSGLLNLVEADADSIHGIPPGRESVANEIWYELQRGGVALPLTRTNDDFSIALASPVTRVDGKVSPDAPPSGNWMENLGERSIEYYQYASVTPGDYVWKWGDVAFGNMIFVNNKASPVAHQMSAEPVGPLKVSAAAPIDSWTTASSLALPLVLGGGSYGGNTTVVNTVAQAQALFGARGGGGMAALLAELLAAKLNVAAAAAAGEDLPSAHLNGNTLRVKQVLTEADGIVETGASTAVIAEAVRLLGAVNAGSINYLPQPLDIAERGDEDGDGIVNVADNCPLVPNDFTDTNQDGIGDACDPKPFVKCVQRRKNGCYGAIFGYENPNEERRIARDARNALSGVTSNAQPTRFSAGTVDSAFQVDFCSGSVTWTVEGNSATATATSPVCEQPLYPPVAADVALYASGQLALSSRVSVASSAAIVNAGSGTTYIDADSTVGDVWSASAVSLRDRVAVTGSVHTAAAVTRGNSVRIAGAVVADVGNLSLLDWAMQFPGTNNGPVTVVQGQPRTLSPGAYSNVVVRSSAQLTLTTGTYYFDSFSPEWSAQLRLVDGSGPVFIYVRNSLTFQGTANSASGGTPRLLVGYFGSQAAVLESGFRGTIIAPNAQLELRAATHEGAFWARDILVQSGARVSYVALPGSTPSVCNDGICGSAEDCNYCPADCGTCPTCSDGIQNQGEAGIDCGGPCSASCGNAGCTCPSGCGSIVNASVGLTVNGVANTCYFVAGSIGSWVNSWSTQLVNLNGTNISNKYVGSASYPARIDGGYYLYLRSTDTWGHLEVR